MKYLVAVSGGVDSVVLLDMLIRQGHEVIIGHVDHGIRGPESMADARFVEALARRYDVPYVATELHLDRAASEAVARQGRYEFLCSETTRRGAMLATAHHLDDLVETVAINIQRGTGWRGLVVLGREDIYRPLLNMTKQQLYEYALAHRLEWVEDATNHTDEYQRNRIRHAIPAGFAAKGALAELRERQITLRQKITLETRQLLTDETRFSRYFFSQIPEIVAIELLGMVCADAVGIRPTRPRLRRLLLAIKTARPGATHQIGEGTNARFTSRNFTLLRV